MFLKEQETPFLIRTILDPILLCRESLGRPKVKLPWDPLNQPNPIIVPHLHQADFTMVQAELQDEAEDEVQAEEEVEEDY